MTPVKMQAKMAPTTVNGIRVLGFTVSSCDAFDERWDSLEYLGFHISVGRVLLCPSV